MASPLFPRGRLEALIDGVSAIAITLLVIEIAVPVVDDLGDGKALLDALQELWPSFLAYLIGFMAVGIWWLHHHALFELLRGVDGRFIVLNLVFLMGIGFVPFTTGLLAEYMGEAGDSRVVAVTVFAGWQLFTALVFDLAWWYAIHDGRLLRVTPDPPAGRRLLLSLWITPVLWLAILLLGLLSAVVAIGLILAATVLWLVWVPLIALPEASGGVPGPRER